MEGFFDINNYDKISDDIYQLGPNMIIRFNVVLNKYNENGKENYHKEFEFYSSKNRSNVRSLRRSFDYYFSIENIRSTDQQDKDYANIRPDYIFKFIKTLELGLLFFSDAKYSGMYQVKDSHLIMVKHPAPLEVQVDLNKMIKIEPIVYTSRYTGESHGVRIYLNTDTNYSEITLDRYVGLYNVLNKMDIYGVACSMINYLQRGVGYNVTSYNNTAPNESRQPPYVKPDKKQNGKTGRLPAYITEAKQNG